MRERTLFTSVLTADYRDELERLLLFNEYQSAVSDVIQWTVERYGAPRVELIRSQLRVALDSETEVQSLFVLSDDTGWFGNQGDAHRHLERSVGHYGTTIDGRTGVNEYSEPSSADGAKELVGLMIYTREEDTLTALFLAVREDFSSEGANRGSMLLLQMIHELRRIGRRIKGIGSITLFVKGPSTKRFPC